MTNIKDYDNVLHVGNIYLVSKTSDQSSKHVFFDTKKCFSQNYCDHITFSSNLSNNKIMETSHHNHKIDQNIIMLE